MMKKILLNIAFVFALTAIISSCEKKEDQVVFDVNKATPPTLSLSTTAAKLNINDADKEGITFTVGSGNYNIATAVSYSIVITLPASGTEPEKVKVISLATDKFKSVLTVDDLNGIFLYDFEKEGGKQYKVNVQAFANYGTPYALKSSVVELTVDTYPV